MLLHEGTLLRALHELHHQPYMAVRDQVRDPEGAEATVGREPYASELEVVGLGSHRYLARFL